MRGALVLAAAPLLHEDIAPKLKPLGILTDHSPPDRFLAEIRAEHARVSEIATKSGLVK